MANPFSDELNRRQQPDNPFAKELQNRTAAPEEPAPSLASAFSGQPTSIMPGGEPMEPGLARDLLRLGVSGIEGFNEGVVRLLELPYDAINNAPRLLNILPGVSEMDKVSSMADPESVLGQLFASEDPGQMLARELGAFGQLQPETPAERITNRAGVEVGMSAVPQAMLTLRGATLPSTLNAGTEIGALDRAFTLPFKNNPGAANLAETLTAAGGGAGAGTMNEMFGDSFANELIGSMGGSLATAGALGVAGNMRRMLQDIGTDSAVRRATGEQLVRSATDPDAAFSEATVARATGDTPGVRPTTGQASADPQVLALEYSRSTAGPRVGQYAQRNAQNNAALRDAFESTAPDAADDTATRAALEGRRRDVLDQADAVTQQRQGRATAARETEEGLTQQRGAAERQFTDEYEDVAAQRALREQGSGQISDTVQQTRSSMGAERRAAYDRAQELGTTKVDATPFTEDVDRIMTDLGPLSDTAADPALKRLAMDIESLEPGSGITVSDLVDLQPRISRALSTSRANMRGDTVRALNRLDDRLRTTLDDLAEQGDEGALAWREANQMSREEAPLFREGVGGQLDKQTRRGAPPAESAVGGKFIRPDGPGAQEGVQQLRQIIDRAADPEAAGQGVRDYVVGSLADRMAGRKPSVKVVDDFIREHRSALQEFPDVRNELRQMRNRLDAGSSKVAQLDNDIAAAATARQGAEESTTRAAKRTAGLEKSLSSDNTTVGRYLNRETGKESMDRILKANKPREEAKKLMQQLRSSPEGQEGARRAFFDLMDDSVSSTVRDANDNPLFRKDQFIKFLNKNSDAATEILGKEHADTLRKLTNDLDTLQRTVNAKPKGSSGTALGQQGTGLTLNSVLSRIYGIQRGVVSPRFVLSELGARAINSAVKKMRSADIDQMLDEALLDPELARTLAMEYSKENERLLTKRLPQIMERFAGRTARGAGASQDSEADTEDEDE